MTIKDQIIQELDQVPESELEPILELVRSLKQHSKAGVERNDEVWQAYLASQKDRVEVYRRLANS